MTNLRKLLNYAVRYAAAGVVVHPVQGKLPTVKAWQTLTVAEGLAAVHEQVRKGWPDNLGIVAGHNSGHLFQLDIDIGRLDFYREALEAMPELGDTWTVRTGSGKGVHVYGRCAGELPPTTLALYKGEHLEIRFKGQGQQCVAPPSLHPDTHQPYETLVRRPISVFEASTLDALIAFVEARRPARAVELPPPHEVVHMPTMPGSKRTYALKALDGMVAEVARLTNVEDDPQNDTMHKNTGKLAVFAQHGDLTHSEVFAAMESAMRSNGYIGAFGYHAFSASFESGWDYGMTDTLYVPNCYQLPPQPTRTFLSDEALERLAREIEPPKDWLYDFAQATGAVIRRLA